MGKFKDFIYNELGIETKEEKIQKVAKEQKEQGSYATMPPQQPTSDEKKKEKEEQWADVSEPLKFVRRGGTVLCKYHSNGEAKM